MRAKKTQVVLHMLYNYDLCACTYVQVQKRLQKEFQYIGMGAAKSNETSERPMNDPCLLRCLTPSLII